MLIGSASRIARNQACALALGASVFALAMGLASPAAAQCAPDPTTAGGTTNCAGTDSNGLVVATDNTRVVVASGAQVQAGMASAAIFGSGGNDSYQIDGAVVGDTSQFGLLLSSGDPRWVPCDPYAGAAVRYCPNPYEWSYPGGSAAITVGQGAAISGFTAVRLQRRSDNQGSVSASIDNSGSLTGTGTSALIASTGTSFTRIDNRATGTINGITGLVGNLSNAGVIVGSTISAVGTSGQASVSNSGQITSASVSGTIHGGTVSVSNSGTIRNNGTGAAIQSADTLSVTNLAGGTIGTAGAVAIRSGGQLTLVNAGTIDGSVRAGAGPYSGSMIDNVAGTINGSVVFGSSNDVLKARFDSATGRIAGISGTVDGGAGMDQLQLAITADASLGHDNMPLNFEQLSLQLANKAVVTIAAANGTANGITASGAGRLINTATLTTTGTAIATTWSSYGQVLDVENRGAITAALASPYLAAVRIYPGSFTNSGSVTSVGGVGVSVDGSNVTSLTNSGTISATSTGAEVRYARLINSGSIQSSTGTGVLLFRDDGTGASINSGTISGATTGLNAYSVQLVNSGTISGGTTGIVADWLRLDNLASGVITGGSMAIDGRNNSGGGSTIRNAGTITGNVDLARTGSYDYTPDVFIDAGGVLDGALSMGGGNDLLVASLGGDASRPLAGVTGGVDMGDGVDTIRFVAATNQSAAIALPASFEAVAYEVQNGAKLTLTSANSLIAPIGFTGSGTIDLSANLSTEGTGIDLSGATVDEILAGDRPWNAEYTANPGLTVISRGTLSFAGSASSGAYCGVSVAGGAFENAGAITTSSGSFYSPTAICAGGSVTNSGTIRIEGGYGIAGSDMAVNRGTLTDVAGSNGRGIAGVQTVVNAGTIVTDLSAIDNSFYSGDITNSGTIESRTDVAVLLGYEGSLVNEASGTIRATEVAVRGILGDVINRGRIVGDVDLSGSWPPTFPVVASAGITTTAVAAAPGSRYVADGGTLTGDLIFGNADDSFVQSGATTGVTGSIIGGGGFDRIVLSTTGQGQFSGNVTGFEQLEVASGSWTLANAVPVPETAIASGATLIGTTATVGGTITDNGTLRIEQNFDGSFGGALIGGGALVKAGTGSVTMGDQLGFTGTTAILGGRLLMNGRSAARLEVVGGTLAGTGTIGGLKVGAGGTVTPADGAIGTLNVSGDFAQTAGSTYIATLTASGQSDQILVGGIATLAQGSRLVLTGTVGGIGTRYTLLSAAGGLTGSYSVVEQPGGDFQLRLVYSASSVFADVARSVAGLARLSTSDNQRATALGLAGLPASNTAYAALTLEADAGLARAGLDQLSGEVHASAAAAMMQDARIVEDAVLTRTLAQDSGAGIWGTMVGNRGTDDGADGSADLRRSTFGTVGGFDVAIDDARIGLAGGYTRTNFNVDARRSDGRTESIHLLGYGGGAIGPVTLRAGLGYAWTDTSVNRTVAFTGVRETLAADYDGSIFHSFLELGHAFAVGGGSVEPLLGYESYRVKTDAFAETGGSAALRGSERSESFAFAKAGLRAETPIVEGLSARVNTAWLHRVHGDAPSLRASFAGAAATFDVAGVPLSRDAAAMGLDLVWSPSANVRIVSGYNGRIGSKGDDSSFRVAASIGF
ncbi:autotransporter domain-containing protein [Sphingomonas psychrotolerans]|uniref:Autotransporter domain-containing protein n=1 Tax=Sphingomonas psychrotolerans TaxID=1327635 RepID=A0ABU3MYL8_9SPHN|nr:autotransporter domain-containing protein [Sphingomonas psychrotolerans]MDT8757327.1 autotransporter domain-containing protein [Sphingomonas psychrotolerans]